MRTRNADKVELVKQKTIELLVADGFEGFSVNKLAKACGISVATLYIYYHDKDDLVTQVAIEEGRRMTQAMLKDFDPEASFEDGLRQQWKSRAAFTLANPVTNAFFEQLRGSSYHQKTIEVINEDFKEAMSRFLTKAIDNGEMMPLRLEVYWSLAFAPLYNLLRFHQEGRSIGGHLFEFNDEILWQTFDLVIKALTPAPVNGKVAATTPKQKEETTKQ